MDRDPVPVSRNVELARRMAERESARGHRPVTLFEAVEGFEEFPVLANPCPKPVLLAAMGLHPERWMTQLGGRLCRPEAPGTSSEPGRWRKCDRGLAELPIVQHRPLDAGPYITAGVCITHSARGDVNLGVYRVQFVDGFTARIFFDPRTDAHRNWVEANEQGRRLTATIFLGASPALLLAGASRLPQSGDDFDLASRLLGAPLVLDQRWGVPVDSRVVIRGTVSAEVEEEGPFAEFKGYYTPARLSPRLDVEDVMVSATDPYYPTIVTGAESGLSLMALQNEYLMHSHLTSLGYRIDDIKYPLAARSEFACFISSPDLSDEMLAAAMDFDARAKLVVCGDTVDFPLTLASHGLTSVRADYYSKGERHGDRVGIVLDRPPPGSPVEF